MIAEQARAPEAPVTISLDEAAALTGISRDTLRRRVQDGTLSGRKIGGLWRVNRISALAMLPPDTAGVEPTAYERAAALLGAMTPAERTEIAKAALTWQEGGRAG